MSETLKYDHIWRILIIWHIFTLQKKSISKIIQANSFSKIILLLGFYVLKTFKICARRLQINM